MISLYQSDGSRALIYVRSTLRQCAQFCVDTLVIGCKLPAYSCMHHSPDYQCLVYNVTEYLFSHGFNIENLETHTEQAAFGGATQFMMAGVIAMPVRLSTHKLIHNLDTLQTTLGVDIAISNLPVSTNHKFQLPSPPQAMV